MSYARRSIVAIVCGIVGLVTVILWPWPKKGR